MLVTAGGDDAIDRACRAVLAEGRTLVLPEPTFEMIARYARLAGAEVVEVPWGDGAYPADAVLAALDARDRRWSPWSAPTTPPGGVATAEDLRRVAAAPQALMLVDLAYVEFGDDALFRAALALPNAVVIRTLSKAWGLAGLRVGYAVGHAALIGWLRAGGGPYAVSGPSLVPGRGRAGREGEAGGRRASWPRSAPSGTPGRASAAGRRARSRRRPTSCSPARCGTPCGCATRWRGWASASGPSPANPGSRTPAGHLPGAPAQFERVTARCGHALAPEALLFDLDGVLADVSGSYRAASCDTARSFGVEAVTAADIAAIKAAPATPTTTGSSRSGCWRRGAWRPHSRQ